jgi:hypothetical protein
VVEAGAGVGAGVGGSLPPTTRPSAGFSPDRSFMSQQLWPCSTSPLDAQIQLSHASWASQATQQAFWSATLAAPTLVPPVMSVCADATLQPAGTGVGGVGAGAGVGAPLEWKHQGRLEGLGETGAQQQPPASQLACEPPAGMPQSARALAGSHVGAAAATTAAAAAAAKAGVGAGAGAA